AAWDLDRQGFMALDPARAVAGGAGALHDFAAAVAFRAGLLDREESLGYAHLSLTAASRAGHRLRAGFCARTATGLALLHGRDAHPGLGAAGGFFQRDFQVVAQVGAAVDVGALAPRTEDVAEDIAESVSETAEARSGRSRPHSSPRVDPGVAVLI